jgi:hypothetical protein
LDVKSIARYAGSLPWRGSFPRLKASLKAGARDLSPPRRLELPDRNRATRREINESIGVHPFPLLQVLNQGIQVIAELTHHLCAKFACFGNDRVLVHFSPFHE